MRKIEILKIAGIVILISFILYGCKSDKENVYDNFECYNEPRIEGDYADQQPYAFIDIKISLVEENKNYGPADVIPIYIENTSDITIWLPQNRNISLWEVVDENNWVSINNLTKYDFVEEIILGPKGSQNSKNMVFIHPDVSVINEPKEVFVSLWGYRFESGLYCEDHHGGRLFIQIIPSE